MRYLSVFYSRMINYHTFPHAQEGTPRLRVNNPIRGDGMAGKGKKPIPFRIKFDKVLYAFISFILLEKYRLNSSVRIRGAATSILLAYPKLIYKPRP